MALNPNNKDRIDHLKVLVKALEEYEKRIITEALKRAGGVKKKAAESLGLSLRSMRYKIDKYDIRKN